MSAALFRKLNKISRLRPAAEVIKRPRMIKDSHEIEQIERAIHITARALGSIKLINRSEEEVANDIDIIFRQNRAGNAFDTIIASGKNAAFIHHRPGSRKIGKKDILIADLGARFNGYCSDVSRTLCASPGSAEREIHENVSSIQAELMDSVRPGIDISEVEKQYEALLKKSGFKPVHGFGHGVGLSVHERIKGKLEKNMVLTIEPGVYKKGFGGCRIEDMLLVNKKPKILTNKIKQALQ
jgi:Xaa-Pro aminopeptidase